MSMQLFEFLYTLLEDIALKRDLSITLSTLLLHTTQQVTSASCFVLYQNKGLLRTQLGIISINNYFQRSIATLIVQLHFIRIKIKVLVV